MNWAKMYVYGGLGGWVCVCVCQCFECECENRCIVNSEYIENENMDCIDLMVCYFLFFLYMDVCVLAVACRCVYTSLHMCVCMFLSFRT